MGGIGRKCLLCFVVVAVVVLGLVSVVVFSSDENRPFHLKFRWDEAMEAYEEAKRIFENLGLQEDVEKQEQFIEAANEGKRIGGEV